MQLHFINIVSLVDFIVYTSPDHGIYFCGFKNSYVYVLKT